jgi:hypothetical protein
LTVLKLFDAQMAEAAKLYVGARDIDYHPPRAQNPSRIRWQSAGIL